MNEYLLLVLIALPALFAMLLFITPASARWVKEVIVITGFLMNLVFNIMVYGREMVFLRPWLGNGMDFSLKLYGFSCFIMMSAAVLSFFVALYTTVYLKGNPNSKQFYAYMLITLALVNGAVLANNLLVMLFFWEAILATMFAMIMLGGKHAYKTAVKAVVISGTADLCLMIGIGMTAFMAQTLTMDQIHLTPSGWGIFAFVCLMIGAVAKGGAMPFHTWIPDAADDAPLPFMAFLPGMLEKLLGIYLLTRISVDFFELKPGSPMSYVLMILGAATIIFAVMMAIIQKDFKKLLSYHAVSQVGYMILGIGTALPVGIIGGIYHMLNNAVYKCGLFLTAGSVERQAGTTDLRQISGLGRKLPVTFISFLIFAASIAGFPFTNGFYSKELIFDAALESGGIFYVIALAGAFFTSVSFLKLGHAAFLGKTDCRTEKVKEAPLSMLISMSALAAICLLLGLGKTQITESLALMQPAVEETADIGATNWLLVGISAVVMALAVLDHYIGYKKAGKAIEAADHIHYAPVLHVCFSLAERGCFDPYLICGRFVRSFAALMLGLNNGISRFYDVYITGLIRRLSALISRAHNGSQSRYVVWMLAGTALTVILIFAVR